MRTYDVVIVGGGLIGVSLAMELRRDGIDIAVIDKAEPGREASWAAAGMLAHCDPHTAPALVPMAAMAARLYPSWVAELQDETGLNLDFRRDGSILFVKEGEQPVNEGWRAVKAADLPQLEPNISTAFGAAFYVPESSLDARQLIAAVLAAAKNRGIEITGGHETAEVLVEDGRAVGVRTSRTAIRAAAVVNCAGAWAGQVSAPVNIPSKPIRGQVVAVVPAHGSSTEPLVRHTVRQSGVVYLAPRSDGRVLVGSTMEDVGFDKRVEPSTIQALIQKAANLVPEIGQASMLESWAGLRPAAPDLLPVMGGTGVDGYFVSTGHFRDGILLAPAAAKLVADVVRGRAPELDIEALSLLRFPRSN